MPQKAKARTGAALPDLAEPELADTSDYNGQPISNAQAADLKPSGGFSSTPAGPTGPSYPSMGGAPTQGSESDFAAKVRSATAVPSKGGPPVEDLYASSGQGPVGRLKRPQESPGTTTKAPEGLADLPAFDPSAYQPIVRQPVAGETPAPTPAAAATTDQGQAAAPEQLPGFSEMRRPGIQKLADQGWLTGSQDYSHIDPYITHDPHFAGMDGNRPVFMDDTGRGYYRFESSEGKGVIHYFDEPAGTKEAKEGRPYEDKDKAEAAEEARNQLNAMMDTQKAIQHWRDLQAQFIKAHPDGENILQRMAVEAKMTGDEGWQAALAKAAAGFVGGVTPDMEELDAARGNMVLPYKASFAKTKESLRIPGSEVGGTPTANDDFQTQTTKVKAMEDRLRTQAETLRAKFPYASQQVDKLLQNFIQATGGSAQQGAQQTGSTGSTARSAATPAGTPRQPSQSEIDAAPHPKTAEDLAKLKSGDLFVDLDGKPKRKH